MKFFKAKRLETLPALHFHNTLSDKLEVYTPMVSGKVKMYNCGPTVYDPVHIGNLRSYVLADTLRRTLEYWHYEVQQVINITDVGHLTSDADEGEDKLEISAKKQGRSAQEIAKEVTALFFNDLDALGINRAAITFPRATEYINEQITLITSLEQKGYTYTISDGVYFDTSKFPEYGKLGHIKLSGLKQGARVQENTEKRSPTDFALWKFPTGIGARQQEWPSPWGKGFPGWHLECTAMIFTLLGKQIDIHTGGIDHIPTHHNGEIAQAEAITGKQYVRYWLHNEFITIEGKRIGKSLGNSIYLHNITDRNISPRALRYLYLTAHYRSPMNFTWDALEGAQVALARLQRFYFEHATALDAGLNKPFMDDFALAIANDLDTPKAIARIWELIKDDSVPLAERQMSLGAVDEILGLGLTEPRKQTTVSVFSITPEIEALLEERDKARLNKDFAKADEVREQIEKMGFNVIDTPSGSKIELL